MEKEKTKKEKEEVKEEKKDYTIEEKEQKRLKGISKFIYVIAKILKVFAVIGIVGVVLAMLVIPVVTLNVKSNKDESGSYVDIFDKKVYYERDEHEVSLFDKEQENDKLVIKTKGEVELFNKVIDYLEENDLVKITIFIEIELALLVAILVVEIMVLKRVHEFFKNIHEKNTPFMEENVDLLFNIGKLLIISFAITFVMSFISSLVVHNDLSIRSVSIAEILIVYVGAYIFKYGVKLQEETKGRIYS